MTFQNRVESLLATWSHNILGSQLVSELVCLWGFHVSLISQGSLLRLVEKQKGLKGICFSLCTYEYCPASTCHLAMGAVRPVRVHEVSDSLGRVQDFSLPPIVFSCCRIVLGVNSMRKVPTYITEAWCEKLEVFWSCANLMPQSIKPLFAMCSSISCPGHEGVLGKILYMPRYTPVLLCRMF